jgi:hypothetical protein
MTTSRLTIVQDSKLTLMVKGYVPDLLGKVGWHVLHFGYKEKFQ